MASPLRSIDPSTRPAPAASRRTKGGVFRSPASAEVTAGRRALPAARNAWRTVGVAAPADPGFCVSCDDCLLAGSSACADCIVTYLCPDPSTGSGAPGGQSESSSSYATKRSVTVSSAEAQTLALFCDVGLAPQLRHVLR